MNKIVKYIEKLVNIASPTGYTNNIINYLKEEINNIGYEVKITNKGNLFLTIKGNDDENHRTITAHVDTLGAIVKSIKNDGRLKIDKIGGYAFNSIEGENCIVHTYDGREISGTILMHQSTVHVYDNVNTANRDFNNIEVRLDEEVFSRENVEDLGIEIGNFISFDPRFQFTNSGFVKSRFLDDKVSVAILLQIIKEIKEEKIELKNTTHFAFSVFEEVGHGLNSSIDNRTVEYLAVDMGAIGDYQETDEYTVSICAKDSSGPYNYDLKNKIVEIAKKNNIKYKIDIYPRYSSDASSTIRAGFDIKHGLLGAGIESSHSYERTHIKSIEETYKLLKEYIKSSVN